MTTFGLIGYPLGHSFSQTFFSELFQREGLHQCRFERFPIASIAEFPRLLDERSDICGLAVTKPYKEEVLQFLHELSEEAQAIGAVNCIAIRNGRLKGHNTDAVGFAQSLNALTGFRDHPALVLGFGGASRAVQHVLSANHIPFRVVQRAGSSRPGDLTYDELKESDLANYRLIVNTTPLGMTPDEEGCPPIPYSVIDARHILYDLIYKPARTTFLAWGEKQGAVTVNGYDMFLRQAEENWTVWRELL